MPRIPWRCREIWCCHISSRTTTRSIRDLIYKILGRKVGYRRPGDQHNTLTDLDSLEFLRPLPVSAVFTRPGLRKRDAVERPVRGNCLPRHENIYSRNFPWNNAVFHLVRSFPLPRPDTATINLATINRQLLVLRRYSRNLRTNTLLSFIYERFRGDLDVGGHLPRKDCVR